MRTKHEINPKDVGNVPSGVPGCKCLARSAFSFLFFIRCKTANEILTRDQMQVQSTHSTRVKYFSWEGVNEKSHLDLDNARGHSSCSAHEDIRREKTPWNCAQRQSEKIWSESKSERGKKTFKVTLVLFPPAAAKHFSVQCCSTFIAQTNFTRGINMAEILGFYDSLHSAGGCVSGVMCSDRLDLNSPDIEKEGEKT